MVIRPSASGNLLFAIGSTERMRITSSGNVGIGTTSPTADSMLHVRRASSGVTARTDLGGTIIAEGSTRAGLYILTSGTSAGSYGSIWWGNGNTNTDAFISVENDTRAMRFGTADGTRMSILSGGNVGIGITSPNSKLDIRDGNIELSDSAFSNIPEIRFTGNSGGRYVYAGIKADEDGVFNGHLEFWTTPNSPNSTAANAAFAERMRITAGGNVGIGTDIPAVSLHVQKNSGIYELIQIQNNSAGALLRAIGLGGGSADFGADDTAASTAVIRTAGTERMRITSGGFLKASNDGTYYVSTGSVHEFKSNASDNTLFVWNSSASPNGIFINYTNSPNNTSNNFLNFYDGNVGVKRFDVRSNGGISNYQANDVNLSDERTKKDIAPLESYWDKFKNIEIVKFKYKDQTHDDYNIGVIAQQVEQVAPEFVDIDGWNTRPKLDEEGNTIVSEEEPLKSIYTSDLHHATIKVLQEAMAKIEEQQTQIESLKAEIQTLKQ
jgi:hypothetical protein